MKVTTLRRMFEFDDTFAIDTAHVYKYAQGNKLI